MGAKAAYVGGMARQSPDDVMITGGDISTDSIETLQDNLALTNMNMALNEGWTVYSMIGGANDAYKDQDGIDTGASEFFYNAATDEYNNSTDKSFLAHLDVGTFLDTSGNAFTPDTIGATLGADAGAIGGQCAVFDGSSQDIVYPDNALWNFGSSDFTVAGRFQWTSASTNQVLIGIGEGVGSTARTQFGHYADDKFYIRSYSTGAETFSVVTGTWSPSLGQWYDIAWCRSGNLFYMFIDGVAFVNGEDVTGETFNDCIRGLSLGSWGNSYFHGKMDEVLVVNGAALYTEAYTPKSVAYTDGTNNGPLVSVSSTAASAPDTARICMYHDPVDSVTLNTDLIGYVSRDGGTTWTDGTLLSRGIPAYDGSYNVLSTGDIDISAQPTGTSMKYKLVSANGKEQKLPGTWVQWR